MFIERFSPLDDLAFMGRDMDRIFSEFFPIRRRAGRKVTDLRKTSSLPALDIIEKDGVLIVNVDMPGWNKDDIEISVEKNTLKLTARRKAKDGFKDESFFHMERNHLDLERSVELPVKIDPDNIRASLNRGVLEITLNKAKELQLKKIKVEAR